MMFQHAKRTTIPNRTIALLGAAGAAAFWIAEGLLHALVFDRGPGWHVLLPTNAHEWWMRSLVACAIVAFGAYAQRIINKLHESTERYRALFENAPDAIFLADAEIERIDTLGQMLKHQEELAHVLHLSCIEDITSHVTHQLSQPLCAMINYTSACLYFLRTGMPDIDKLVHNLTAAVQQAERAGQIINSIKNLPKKHEPHVTLVDINNLIERLSGSVAADVHRHNVRLSFQLARQLPVVSADPLQIELVLLSLVRNGIEAIADAQAGRRHLSIRTSSMDDTVEVAVGDTGGGVSDEIGEKIFDSFFSTKPNGLGLGLSISRSIIEGHGGQLWADKNPDCGMTFRFRLPVAEVTPS
jgi:C4-dicarboxylate-specific signal transduction histidine kinase